jgi:hypothetical protein
MKIEHNENKQLNCFLLTADDDSMSAAYQGDADYEVIKHLIKELQFFLAFAPDEPAPGLDPTFYITGSYDGDKRIWDRTVAIKKLLDGK